MIDKILEALLVQTRETNDRILAKLHDLKETNAKLHTRMDKILHKLDNPNAGALGTWAEKKKDIHGV